MLSNFFNKSVLLVRETIKTFQANDPVVYAAAIAFFTVFSLPSVLIIIVRVMGDLFSVKEIQQNLATQIEDLIGPASAEEILNIIENRDLQSSSVLLGSISIIFLVISATVIFAFLQKALNAIWNVKPKPKAGALKFARDRLLSFSFIIILGFLMIVSLALDTILSFARSYLEIIFTDYTVYFMELANYFVSLIVISLIFALIFKFLPDAKVRWRDVGVGALFTGLLFTLGKFLIGLMLSNTNITSTYGAAGSLAGILIWVFYSSIIVLIGAMFTKVYAANIGREITPKKHSVRIETREIEK